MKKNNISKIICAITALLVGFSAFQASAEIQNDPVNILSSSNSCCGKYYAYARMTNNLGLTWIKPPTNVVVSSGTLTDISGFGGSYSSVASVTKFGATTSSCAANTVTFPATNSATYQFTVYVTSPTPPPTNSQPLVIQVTWQ